MPKRFSFRRKPSSTLMGAGAVLHPIMVRRPANPALHDALALQKDQIAIAEAFWDSIAVVEAASLSSSRSLEEFPSEPDADDGAGQS
jgi:predicted RNase H-like nuclease